MIFIISHKDNNLITMVHFTTKILNFIKKGVYLLIIRNNIVVKSKTVYLVQDL